MVFRRRSQPSPPSPLGPKIEPLTAAEEEWRDNQLEIAGLLAARFGGASDVHGLDRVVAGWFEDDESRVDINTLVNAVGIAMGQHVAEATGLAWAIATDEHGSDLALHGQPGDILIYPANAAAKRVTAGERRFVAELVSQFVSGVQERRAAG